MSNTISGNQNIPDKFAYAEQDKDTNEKVVYSEAKSKIEGDSVFTQTKNSQIEIVQNKIVNTFGNITHPSVNQTVAKYLNGTSLAQILESKITTMFNTIEYQKATVVSNESVSGYQEDGDEGTDASDEKISKHTTGYSQALTQEVAKKISAQVSEIADAAKNDFESKLGTAIIQAQSELVKGKQQDTYANTEKEIGEEFDGAVHTYTSASQGKKDVGSAGYEATYATLAKEKGFKVKIRNVDGQDLKVISYKKGGETKHVIIDDEGNIHELNETKSSIFRKNSYLTDESLSAMRDATGNNNLKAKDIKILKRKTTDADSGTTKKGSVAITKDNDRQKHYYSVTNDAPSGGYIDNSVSVNEAVVTKDGAFRKKQFVSGDSVGTIMRNGGKAVKQNGHRTIQTREGDYIDVQDNSIIQGRARDFREQDELAQFKKDAAEAGYNVQIVGGKVQLLTFQNGKMITKSFESLQKAKDAFDSIQNDVRSDKNRADNAATHNGTAQYDAGEVDIRPTIPADSDNGWTTTTFEGEENVRISPKAKNVHFKRSEWNHNWSKNNSTLLNNFKQNAHSAEDVFNLLLASYNLDPADYDYSKIRDVLISNNPSIFDNNGHVYKGASFAKRLDLPTKEVIEQLCKRPVA